METLTTITLFLKQGTQKLLNSILDNIIFVIINASMLLWTYCKYTSAHTAETLLHQKLGILAMILVIILWIITDFIYLVLTGMPSRVFEARKEMEKIGFCNAEKEYPTLLSEEHDGKKITLVFDSAHIPLTEWSDKKERLETAMDLTIVNIKNTAGKKKVVVEAVPAISDLPDMAPWKKTYLSNEDFVITLGEGYLGTVSVNLNKIPHMLIGGSTGSGKTVLMLLVLTECFMKNAKVYLFDGKGGIDYSTLGKRFFNIITEKEQLLTTVNSLIDEMNHRKEILNDSGCANISEYNDSYPLQPLQHIVLAIDELAEVTSTKGSSKENKEISVKIVEGLSTIARLGRAFGIHLVLATQRPDADVVPGQIKNNIDCRICGRADNVLSQMILDNTDAADKISKDSAGRFLMSDGTIFQSYYLDGKTKSELVLDYQDCQ